ncbi:acyltransferase [Candidatus Roizmanbacteria bacterium CG_4_10_14_0_2_um_filter_39_13]|uniref:Acyltransferase n=1 Tax=Candidatus Roizmanbacteria bacterium CG_4_10_14_0_2_um_filter_39_13 TaxID=1974825 RepID=A0A2M7U0E1_9BACT|nr:MAG: acyltransferase [Candidatus Roizmanbacteria bacterium CG_4_10_14_0_2_um_filter_39_13]
MKITDKDGNSLSPVQTVDKVSQRAQQTLLEIELFILSAVGWIPVSMVRTILYRLAGIKIGSKSVINVGARMYNPELITIGNDSIIGEGAILDGRDTLTIGDHVDIASQVMIYNSQHDINDATFSATQEPVKIEDYVFIGPRSIILPGVTIGRGAVVGAGAVVTKDVGPFSIVGGVPAQKIGERKNKNPSYQLRRKGLFDFIFG